MDASERDSHDLAKRWRGTFPLAEKRGNPSQNSLWTAAAGRDSSVDRICHSKTDSHNSRNPAGRAIHRLLENTTNIPEMVRPFRQAHGLRQTHHALPAPCTYSETDSRNSRKFARRTIRRLLESATNLPEMGRPFRQVQGSSGPWASSHALPADCTYSETDSRNSRNPARRTIRRLLENATNLAEMGRPFRQVQGSSRPWESSHALPADCTYSETDSRNSRNPALRTVRRPRKRDKPSRKRFWRTRLTQRPPAAPAPCTYSETDSHNYRKWPLSGDGAPLHGLLFASGEDALRGGRDARPTRGRQHPLRPSSRTAPQSARLVHSVQSFPKVSRFDHFPPENPANAFGKSRNSGARRRGADALEPCGNPALLEKKHASLRFRACHPRRIRYWSCPYDLTQSRIYSVEPRLSDSRAGDTLRSRAIFCPSESDPLFYPHNP